MAQVVAMLQRKNGATIGEIMREMGWLKHTVRGFVAGALKKAGTRSRASSPREGSAPIASTSNIAAATTPARFTTRRAFLLWRPVSGGGFRRFTGFSLSNIRLLLTIRSKFVRMHARFPWAHKQGRSTPHIIYNPSMASCAGAGQKARDS